MEATARKTYVYICVSNVNQRFVSLHSLFQLKIMILNFNYIIILIILMKQTLPCTFFSGVLIFLKSNFI